MSTIDADTSVDVTFTRVVTYTGTVSVGELQKYAEKMAGKDAGFPDVAAGGEDMESVEEGIRAFLYENPEIVNYAPSRTWSTDSEDDTKIQEIDVCS